MSEMILDPMGRYVPTIDELVERYSKSGSKLDISLIESEDIRNNMAKLLWNQETKDPMAEMQNLFSEAVTTTTMGGSNAQFQPYAMALMRRLFPVLFAHKTVGVQALNGPVGLAYALRVKYADGLQEAMLDWTDNYSGFTGTTSGTSGTADAGRAVATATAEAWAIGTNYPELKIEIAKTAIEAATRKLAATFTTEAAQDLKAMHNVDVAREMVRYLQAEIAAELDREIIGRMKAAAVDTANGGATATTINVSASDGRWSQEKLAVVVNMIVDKSNEIAVSTKRDAGNFVIVSPKVATALQAVAGQFTKNTAAVNASIGPNKIAEIGTINGTITVYRDVYARTDYALVGYKGEGISDAGLIYCPYITGLISQAVDANTFAPRIGTMSRYAVVSNLLDSGRYYRLINFTNIASVIGG